MGALRGLAVYLIKSTRPEISWSDGGIPSRNSMFHRNEIEEGEAPKEVRTILGRCLLG